MGLFQTFKTLLFVHIFLAYVFIVSGLIVNFLQLLSYLLVWPWNKSLYRKIVSNLGYCHWCQMVALGQWWSGSNCTLHFKDPYDLRFIGTEHSIVIMNHKYDIDWLSTWILAERIYLLGGTRVYGKSTLRYVPLIGWAWIFVESIFLYRDWEKDRNTIREGIKNLMEYPDRYFITLLLFPEGTRFTEEKHRKSMEVAKQKGLPILKHHLLPRTKGFTETILALKSTEKKFAAIYDLTIGFRSDGAEPTLMNIINGRQCKSEIYARRIPLDQVPCDSEEKCAEWLQQLFREKDEIYDHFVENGRYKMGTKVDIPARPHDLVISLLWIFLLGIPVGSFLYYVIFAGSMGLKLTVLGILLVVAVIVRKMIAVTEIKKGSSYGKQVKSSNNNKKTI